MLTGMLKPTAGEIYFDGKPWDRRCLSEIGALIENPPIYENLSARDNLKVRSLLLGTDEKRIDDVLKMVSYQHRKKEIRSVFDGNETETWNRHGITGKSKTSDP